MVATKQRMKASPDLKLGERGVERAEVAVERKLQAHRRVLSYTGKLLCSDVDDTTSRFDETR